VRGKISTCVPALKEIMLFGTFYKCVEKRTCGLTTNSVGGKSDRKGGLTASPYTLPATSRERGGESLFIGCLVVAEAYLSEHTNELGFLLERGWKKTYISIYPMHDVLGRERWNLRVR
jgi:hypothetical protein